MGFDVKDIVDILPFILDNLSMCAYIIIISVVSGFFVGKQFEKSRQKKEISDLKIMLAHEKENIERIKKEKELLSKSVDDTNKECEMLKNKLEGINGGLDNLKFPSVSEFGRMLGSPVGKVEISALIELNYEIDQETHEDKH